MQFHQPFKGIYNFSHLLTVPQKHLFCLFTTGILCTIFYLSFEYLYFWTYLSQLWTYQHSFLFDLVLFVEELHYLLEILVEVYLLQGFGCFSGDGVGELAQLQGWLESFIIKKFYFLLQSLALFFNNRGAPFSWLLGAKIQLIKSNKQIHVLPWYNSWYLMGSINFSTGISSLISSESIMQAVHIIPLFLAPWSRIISSTLSWLLLLHFYCLHGYLLIL